MYKNLVPMNTLALDYLNAEADEVSRALGTFLSSRLQQALDAEQKTKVDLGVKGELVVNKDNLVLNCENWDKDCYQECFWMFAVCGTCIRKRKRG